MDIGKPAKSHGFSLKALLISRSDRSDMNFSHEEAERKKKKSGAIIFAQ